MGFLKNIVSFFDPNGFKQQDITGKLGSRDVVGEVLQRQNIAKSTSASSIIVGRDRSVKDDIDKTREKKRYKKVEPIQGLGEYFFRLRFSDYTRPTNTKESLKSFDTNFEAILPLPLALNDKATVDLRQADLGFLGDLAGQLPGVINTLTSPTATAQQVQDSLIGAARGLTPSAFNRLFYNVAPRFLESLPVVGGVFRNADAVLQQTFGSLPNPNASIALSGLPLRMWQYTWLFIPHDEQESEDIQTLIKQLKNRTLPFSQKLRDDNDAVSGLLGYPQLVLMNFYPWDGNGNGLYQHSDESIVKAKRMMIRDVDVRYHTDGQPQYFKDTRLPVTIQLSLTLQEVEYFLSEDEPVSDRVYPEAQDVGGNIQEAGQELINTVAGEVGSLFPNNEAQQQEANE